MTDLETALGAMVTAYSKPGSLDSVYGNTPVSVQVFLRIRPRRMPMEEHGAHAKPMPHGSGHH